MLAGRYTWGYAPAARATVERLPWSPSTEKRCGLEMSKKLHVSPKSVDTIDRDSLLLTAVASQTSICINQATPFLMVHPIPWWQPCSGCCSSVSGRCSCGGPPLSPPEKPLSPSALLLQSPWEEVSQVVPPQIISPFCNPMFCRWLGSS